MPLTAERGALQPLGLSVRGRSRRTRRLPCPALPWGWLQEVPAAHQTHGKVANSERVLQKPFEGHGPAGNPPLTQAPAALHAGEAGIAAQAVVAHAVLQVGAVQLCGAAQTSLTCGPVPLLPTGPSPSVFYRRCIQPTQCGECPHRGRIVLGTLGTGPSGNDFCVYVIGNPLLNVR